MRTYEMDAVGIEKSVLRSSLCGCLCHRDQMCQYINQEQSFTTPTLNNRAKPSLEVETDSKTKLFEL